MYKKCLTFCAGTLILENMGKSCRTQRGVALEGVQRACAMYTTQLHALSQVVKYNIIRWVSSMCFAAEDLVWWNGTYRHQQWSHKDYWYNTVVQVVMKTKDIKIVAATASEDVGGQHLYRDTTVPLAVQPQHIRDTSEVSTPYSKKKQVWQYRVSQKALAKVLFIGFGHFLCDFGMLS